MIRQFVHFIIVILAGFFWFVAYWLFVICALLILLANKVLPDYNKGNCWTYAGLKWMQHGGYLAIRKIKDNAFVKMFPVVHVVWIKEFSKENKIEQTIPIKRKSNKWLPYHIFYFPFKISKVEKPHNADNVDIQ